MPVGDDGEVDFRDIDVELFGVLQKQAARARIEQQPIAARFDVQAQPVLGLKIP